MAMSVKYLRCLGPSGFHRIAYAEWPGPAAGRVIVCVHGLTRNGRDFDRLAERLSQHGTVLAPDMPGRGESDWLDDSADYAYPNYLADVAALIARSGAESVDFVGTSMGGIIGMFLAAQKNSPIRRLVLNDIGPFVPKAGLDRIATYLGADPKFADVAALEAYIRVIQAPFGNLTDADWQHLARYGHRELPGGGVGLAYDPAIAEPFKGGLADVNLWPIYGMVRCPTLVIRGRLSDLLTAEVAEQMSQRGPKARLFEVADAGHAPALMAADQIDAVERFFGEQFFGASLD